MSSQSKNRTELKRIREARDITKLTGEPVKPFWHRNHRTKKKRKKDINSIFYKKKKEKIIIEEIDKEINGKYI